MSSTDSLPQARAQFASAKLAFPPIPDDLTGKVQSLGEWAWGTRTDAPGLYSFQQYVDEYLSGGVKTDYLMFGHAGYGMNTYAMHYYLVRGPLAVFDQMAWGGVYMDNPTATELVEVHFVQIQVMLESLDTAIKRGLIHPEEQFVVALSDFYGSRWARVSEGLVWRREANSLLTLLDAVIAAQEIVEQSE